MKSLRTAPIPEAKLDRYAPKCLAPGCVRSTRERKPYCPDHVALHPYVAGLMGVLDEREEELARVRRRGAKGVDPHGITAQEIVLKLRLHGNRTIPRLSRDLVLEEDVVDSYARALARRGWVELGRTSRGVTLLCPKRLPSVESSKGAKAEEHAA